MKQGTATFGVIAVIVIIVLGISALVGGLLWPYTINSWLVFFDRPASVTFWQGALIGFVPVVGHATIPVAFVTWVLMLFIG